MTTEHQNRIAILCSKQTYHRYVDQADLQRLHDLAEVAWIAYDEQAEVGQVLSETDLAGQIGAATGLILSGGAPRITGALMELMPDLRIIGDMDGDRFANRIDVEAAWARHIRVVDTTNGTSYPVAEWALGLILISLRNAGFHFRNIMAGDAKKRHEDAGYLRGDLTGKRVGLIGCGHIGRRLMKFLAPFEVDIYVHDPYLPREMADALGFTLTSLDIVMSGMDVIVCLAPLTPRTKGLIGKRELDLIPSNAVFVNVSRGAIVDSDALITRLKRGDIIAGLDVFDPEPIPSGSEIIHLPNVFLSPHIAGVTAPSYPKMFSLMVDEMIRFFNGHEPYFELSPRSIANRRGTEYEV